MGDIDGDFDQFVRAKAPGLIRAGYLLTADQHLAEDLVQSALARTYRSWRSLRDPAAAEAYTRKTMYHLQIAWWRRRRIREAFGAVMPDRGVGGVVDQIPDRILVRAALAKLSPRQRAVVVLRFYEDLTESATAAMLSVSVGTVKVQTTRALARLRDLLGTSHTQIAELNDGVRR